jgi:hypothetical protein
VKYIKLKEKKLKCRILGLDSLTRNFLYSHHQNLDYFRSGSCNEQNDTGMSNYGRVFNYLENYFVIVT